VKYLLDVNALVALGLLEHEFHERVGRWVLGVSLEKTSELATCAITELGFIRVLVQAPQYEFDVLQAREFLRQLKSAAAVRFAFIPDDQAISHLPAWVRRAKHITDGHLAELARSHSAILATLDRKIPRAFLIPR
jgi:uncharacterized protein